MMKFELGLEEPTKIRASQSARNIALSYIAGGFIPLSAYFFTHIPYDGLIISSVVTLLALLIFGYFKSKVTGQPPLEGSITTAAIGAIAAFAAFIIARQFQ